MVKFSKRNIPLLVTFFILFYGLFNPVYPAQTTDKIAYVSSNTNVINTSTGNTEKNTLEEIQELKSSIINVRKWVYANSIVKTNTKIVLNNEDYYNKLLYKNNNSEEYKALIDKNHRKTKQFKTLTNSRNLKISSPFGYRINPVTGLTDYHQGIDIPIRKGTPVYAYKKGIIEKVNNNTRLNAGKYVLIQHPDGSESYYMHLSKTLVKADQQIPEGELIGYSGSTGRTTGPHLHFEIRKNNIAVNPLLIGDAKWYLKSY